MGFRREFIDFTPKYLCMLDVGCSTTGHSMNCEELNREYLEIQILDERKRRRNILVSAGVEF